MSCPAARIGPATAADLVGEYEPTPETLGDRKVTFRLVLSKDGSFTSTFKGASGATQTHKGTWKFDGEKVVMTATTLNGTRLRETETTEARLDGADLLAENYRLRRTGK